MKEIKRRDYNMGRAINEIGNTYTYLTVIERAENNNRR
jgi:hypothetical protein